MATIVQRNILANHPFPPPLPTPSTWRRLVLSFSTLSSVAALSFSYYMVMGSYLAYASGTLGTLNLSRNIFKPAPDLLRATSRLPIPAVNTFTKDTLAAGVQTLYEDLVCCGLDAENRVIAMQRFNALYDALRLAAQDANFAVDPNMASQLITLQHVIARTAPNASTKETASFDIERLYAVLLVNGVQDKAQAVKTIARLKALGNENNPTLQLIENVVGESTLNIPTARTIAFHVQSLLIKIQTNPSPNDRGKAMQLFQALSLYLRTSDVVNAEEAVENLSKILLILDPQAATQSGTRPSVPSVRRIVVRNPLSLGLSSEEITQRKTVYCALQGQKWKEGFESYYHVYGHDVFDKGSHGGTVEPGFSESWYGAVRFLNESFDRPFSPELYLELHRAACKHFRGAKNGVLMGQEKVGVFRDSDDPISWNVRGTYKDRLTPETERELTDLDQKIFQRHGVHLAAFTHEPNGDVYLKYATLPREKVRAIFKDFCDNFHTEIALAGTDPELKFRAICRLFRHMEWLHSPKDGCGRCDLLSLNFLLTQYGFNPTILDDCYISNVVSFNEWVETVRKGTQDWRNIRDGVA